MDTGDMGLADTTRLDRSVVETASSFEEAERKDREYWWSRTPEERLAAAELMRQIVYNYDPSTARLQRVLEFVAHEPR